MKVVVSGHKNLHSNYDPTLIHMIKSFQLLATVAGLFLVALPPGLLLWYGQYEYLLLLQVACSILLIALMILFPTEEMDKKTQFILAPLLGYLVFPLLLLRNYCNYYT